MNDELQYGLSSETRRRDGKGSQTGHWEEGRGMSLALFSECPVEFKGPMTQDSSQKT